MAAPVCPSLPKSGASGGRSADSAQPGSKLVSLFLWSKRKPHLGQITPPHSCPPMAVGARGGESACRVNAGLTLTSCLRRVALQPMLLSCPQKVQTAPCPLQTEKHKLANDSDNCPVGHLLHLVGWLTVHTTQWHAVPQNVQKPGGR